MVSNLILINTSMSSPTSNVTSKHLSATPAASCDSIVSFTEKTHLQLVPHTWPVMNRISQSLLKVGALLHSLPLETRGQDPRRGPCRSTGGRQSGALPR